VSIDFLEDKVRLGCECVFAERIT